MFHQVFVCDSAPEDLKPEEPMDTSQLEQEFQVPIVIKQEEILLSTEETPSEPSFDYGSNVNEDVVLAMETSQPKEERKLSLDTIYTEPAPSIEQHLGSDAKLQTSFVKLTDVKFDKLLSHVMEDKVLLKDLENKFFMDSVDDIKKEEKDPDLGDPNVTYNLVEKIKPEVKTVKTEIVIKEELDSDSMNVEEEDTEDNLANENTEEENLISINKKSIQNIEHPEDNKLHINLSRPLLSSYRGGRIKTSRGQSSRDNLHSGGKKQSKMLVSINGSINKVNKVVFDGQQTNKRNRKCVNYRENENNASDLSSQEDDEDNDKDWVKNIADSDDEDEEEGNNDEYLKQENYESWEIKNKTGKLTDKFKYFECFSCSLRCKSKKALTLHCRLVHPDDNSVHEKSGSKFKCHTCDFVCRTKAAFTRHRSTVHMDISKNSLPCDFCGKIFFERYRLTNHLLIHKNIKPFKCPLCDFSSRSKKEIYWHKNAIHLKIKRTSRFKCSVCDFSSASKEDVSGHETIHKFPEGTEIPKPYKCDVCGNGFLSKFRLRMHTQEHKKKKCTICSELFSTLTQLRHHKEEVHKMIKEYKCDKCDKVFPCVRGLRLHKVSHSEARYFCDTCGKGFKQKAHIEQHMITHSDARPISCTLCDETFKRKTHLKQHVAAFHKKQKR